MSTARKKKKSVEQKSGRAKRGDPRTFVRQFSSFFEPTLKEYVLGKRYDLSVAFLSPAQMKKAMVYKKPKPKSSEKLASNVLAFPLSPKSGEILICKSTAGKQAASYRMDRETFIVFLFIHGLLHLKGLGHGATMEHEERRIMKKFGLRIRE